MSFLFALTFLTRIPVPIQLKYNEELAAKSMGYYPLVGMIIGIILVLLDKILSLVFPLNIVNVMLLLVLVYLSGGLHLDGFMDTMDGIFSGRNREKIMDIMHDSRVGSFGVIAFFLLFLLKFNSLTVISGVIRIPTLILMPTISRWFIVFIAYNYPTAPSSKLGKSFAIYLTRKQVFLSSLWVVVIIIVLNYYFQFSYYFSFILLIIPLILVVFFTNSINKKIGGMTGDIYGAINEITEVLVLLILIGLDLLMVS